MIKNNSKRSILFKSLVRDIVFICLLVICGSVMSFCQTVETNTSGMLAEVRIESSLDLSVGSNAEMRMRRTSDSYFGNVSLSWDQIVDVGSSITKLKEDFSFGVHGAIFSDDFDNLRFSRSGFDSNNASYRNLLFDIRADGNRDGSSNDPAVILPSGSKLRFGSAIGGSTISGSIERIIINTPLLIPRQNNVTKLGSSSFRYSAVYAAGGVFSSSDMRLKEDIAPIAYGIRELMRLRPVTYFWKDTQDPTPQLGLLAQEVSGIIPEAVVGTEIIEQEDGSRELRATKNYGMNYENLLPVVIRAIQEQQSEIADLTTRLNQFIKDNY